MKFLPYISALALLLPVIGVRLLFLIPGRLGWINYLANVFSEFFVKKAGWSRGRVECSLAVLGLAALRWAGAGGEAIGSTLVLLLALEIYANKAERQLLVTSYTAIEGFPAPSTHPELTLNLVGPLVSRMPRYDLGALLIGRRLEMRLIIGNHTIVPTQTPIRVSVQAPGFLERQAAHGELTPRLAPGEFHELKEAWIITAPAKAGKIRFNVEWGPFHRELDVHFSGASAAAGATIARASVTRYPGGCRSAFAWRGDMDLYDETTLQSIEGLETALGLAARYRMPQTMYLSTRLSLDAEAARQWGGHYGVDRGAARIPEFIKWMQANVEFRHECRYPFASRKRFVLELGNHGHLHFGTDTAGAAENGWKAKARMGAGVYPWLGADHTSFGEQRDNALETRRLCELHFAASPRSWAMPDRTNDRFTAAAMEAAGCEVLSDSDVRARHNVLLQPPPHHPGGTHAVELTKRYPGDPQHIHHVAMNLFWIHRAHRKGIPVVFMCHQHLRQYDGYACARLTEHTLRYALHEFHGDLHINTVYGIGKYWREVLSAKTRRVAVSLENNAVRVRNGSDADVRDMPVDVELEDGRRFTVLANAAAGQESVCAIP